MAYVSVEMVDGESFFYVCGALFSHTCHSSDSLQGVRLCDAWDGVCDSVALCVLFPDYAAV